MEDNQKAVRTAIIILILLVAAIGIYYLFIADRGKPPVSDGVKPAEKIGGQELPGDGLSGKPVTVALDQSDAVVREMAGEVSLNPLFLRWLKSPDLIRRFVAAVDSIANGQSPRPQADFFVLKGEFAVISKNGKTFLDPASYERYNIVADVFDSVSAESCAKLYRDFRPSIQQAYRDLGYPTGDFERILLKAIVEVLRTPIFEAPIAVEKKVATYVLVDSKIEEMSPPQKHLLRMGPENVQLIQAKLRELARALGFPETDLPKVKTSAAD